MAITRVIVMILFFPVVSDYENLALAGVADMGGTGSVVNSQPTKPWA
jgi:hypothetical protein